MKRTRARREGGFSLLEVVVAMTIMAMSLGVLYQAGGGALRSVVETGTRTRATALALSLLDEQWHVPSEGLHENGSFGNMEWSRASMLFQPARDGEWAIHQVEVTVRWGGRNTLRLTSLLPERANPLESER
jgi:general secretion pathway protein I